MDEVIGELASHYRILERLGQGGMGEVYLAEDLRLRRRVALKMLRPGSCDEETEDRLLREARAASALNHPNIAVVYEIEEAEGPDGKRRFIAMEFVPGDTLAQASRRGDLSLDQILDWITQAADALSDAHAKGIVHRDVKPSNIIVTGEGRVKVLDFGLARQAALPEAGDATWTRDLARGDGALVGTLAYVAPEQALGEDVDGRADVFSLGAVLYELLAGHAAFEGRTATQILDAVLRRDPAPLPPRFSDPRLPRVEALLRRMLAKDRDARYLRMREVRDDLRAIRGGGVPEGVTAPGPRSVAVMSFASLTPAGEDEWLGTGMAETVAADLRGAGLTVVSRERVDEALRRLDATDAAGGEGLAVRVGRDVGADWVLAGAFQRAGDMVRVTARVVDVDTGHLTATVKVDGRLGEVFEVQDRIGRELKAALPLAAPKAERSPANDETVVLEAYEAFSKGLINLRLETYESLDRAITFFERAIRLDPGYVHAHLELGAAYAVKGEYLALPDFHERALASLRRAQELRPTLARAWREIGSVLVLLGREEEGIPAIKRAMELDPEDDRAVGSLARAHFIGQADFATAADLFDRALALNPQAGWYALQLAHCAALLGAFPRGEAAARRAVALQEASLSGKDGMVIVGSYMRLGQLAALQGRHEDAVSAFGREQAFLERVDHALRGRINIELHMRLAASRRRSGDEKGARSALDTAQGAFEERLRLGADDPFTRYYAACIYALRAMREEALSSLERAARVRRRFTVERARKDPELASLRSEPRFRDLVG